MDSYDSERERSARLRKLILHSADVLPGEVTAYVEGALKRPRGWEEKDQLLSEFRPLSRHLPAVFVDFALGHLIEVKRSRHLDWSDLGPDRLGIRAVMEYTPAAPVQGPFLYLLRENEQEGLRLVHGLVNAATDRWRGVERLGSHGNPPRTPIALKLDFPHGEQIFWGDDCVYRWYRGTSVGPNAVVSALMALEMWLEQQLDSGRDATELLAATIKDSRSVAVLGILVSIALAYPAKGLDILAPLVTNARVWQMDIARCCADGSGTPVFDFLGRHKEIDRILSERNKLPRRRVDIRWLVVYFLFNEKRKDAFAEQAQTFGAPLPFQFEEEASDASSGEAFSEQMENYRALFDEKNYRVVPVEGGIGYQYMPPSIWSSVAEISERSMKG